LAEHSGSASSLQLGAQWLQEPGQRSAAVVARPPPPGSDQGVPVRTRAYPFARASVRDPRLPLSPGNTLERSAFGGGGVPERVLYLVVKTQASFRGMQARKMVRERMAVEGSKKAAGLAAYKRKKGGGAFAAKKAEKKAERAVAKAEKAEEEAALAAEAAALNKKSAKAAATEEKEKAAKKEKRRSRARVSSKRRGKGGVRFKPRRRKSGDEPQDGKLGHWFLYVAYALAYAWCLINGLFVMMTGISFGPELTIEWLGGCVGSTVYEGVVQDPFRTTLLVVFSDNAEVLLDLYYEFEDFLPFEL